jgi:hypothetical protein
MAGYANSFSSPNNNNVNDDRCRCIEQRDNMLGHDVIKQDRVCLEDIGPEAAAKNGEGARRDCWILG